MPARRAAGQASFSSGVGWIRASGALAEMIGGAASTWLRARRAEMGRGAVVEADRFRSVDMRTTHTAASLKLHLWAPAFTGFGGGIASFSRAIALGLKDLGHEIRLFGKVDRSAYFDGLRLSGTGQYAPISRSHTFAAKILAAATFDRPDHILSTHVNFGPVAHLAKRTLGTPYTLVAHGIDIHPGLKADTLAALRAADRIVAVSSWTRGRVLDLGGIEPDRVSVLPNTFDKSRFCVGPRPVELARRYGIQPHERVVLTVARLAADERYKGYDRILYALSKLQNECGSIRFVLVGQGEDQSRITALARRLGVDHLITFAGFISDHELADHYRLADVFAMPSTGEGFGIVFLEAMGCGAPVVAGNRDGSVDALDHGRLGCLVDPTDVTAIAGGIRSLLEKRGPEWWFDRSKLSSAVTDRFGDDAFRSKVTAVLQF